MIGIIGAMEEEVSQLVNKMTDIEKTEIAGMVFNKGSINGKELVVVKSGIGKVNAAMCTQILATYFKVDTVINTGVAGSLRNEINIGDVVISTDALQHDMDATGFGYKPGVIPRMKTSIFEADKKLIDVAEAACKKAVPEIGVFKGRVVSGDQFIESAEKKKFLELESVLHKRVIGQDEAVNVVSDAIRRNRSGLARTANGKCTDDSGRI